MGENKKYEVRFLPSGKSIKVPPDYNLRQAILDCGLTIDSSCGGVGTCGRCRVKVLNGSVDSEKTRLISAKDKKAGIVLSCLAKVKSDLEVEIPEQKEVKAKIAEGRFKPEGLKGYAGVSSSELSEVEVSPWIIKENLTVKKPSLSYGTSDFYRLKKSITEKTDIKDPEIPIHIIRKLPHDLRSKRLGYNSYHGQEKRGADRPSQRPSRKEHIRDSPGYRDYQSGHVSGRPS